MVASPPPDLSASAIARRAETLLEAHRRGLRFAPFAGVDALPDLDHAYTVQAAYVAALAARDGLHVGGYKIGLTSPRMQALCGIPNPIAGVVFAERLLPSGVTLRRRDHGRLGLEFEIGVRLGRDLLPDAAPFAPATVAAAVDAVCAAVEVVDDRHAEYPLHMPSLVADNAWNAAVVTGPFVAPPADLAAAIGRVCVDGVEVDRGCGADVLGHPYVALTWLANHLAGGQRGLRAGDVVATGSLVTTRFPHCDGHYAFEVDGLGRVELAVGA